MRKYYVVLFILSTIVSYAQSKSECVKYGDAAFAKGDYATAVKYYARVLSDTAEEKHMTYPYQATPYHPELLPPTDGKPHPTLFDEMAHKIAVACYNFRDYENAARYFEMVSLKPAFFPEAKYYFAMSLMNMQKYKEAMAQFEMVTTLKNIPDSLKKLAAKNLTGCYFALDAKSEHKLVKVRKSDTVFNNGTASFAAMYFGGQDRVLFTSARKGNLVADPHHQDPEYTCDVFVSEKFDGAWGAAKRLPSPINGGVHDGAAYATLDNDYFITKWNDQNKSETAIYIVREINNHIMDPLKLGKNINLPGYKSMHPFITMDGTRLYFSSNRPGGKGGMDIWYCKIDENGTTSEPVCLGENINTPGDEVTPYYHAPSHTLFFSSDGQGGLGGLDIFKSSFNVDDSLYEVAKNLGSPFNSSKDDAYFIIDRAQEFGFFSSDREECSSGHCYDIYEFENEPISFEIEGFVFDSETNQPVPNAVVTLKDVHGDDENLVLYTNSKGQYTTSVKPEKEYFIKAQKNKFVGDAWSFASLGKTETTRFERDFFISRIPEVEVYLNGIEFDPNKAVLKPEAKKVCDKLYDFLHINENIIIELGVHTDTKTNDENNMKLSQARAKAIVDYLVSKKIAKDRIVIKAWGSSAPIISSDRIANLPTEADKEAAQKRNRRIYYKVIGETQIGATSGSTN